jgi:putative resolvase
VRRLAGARPKIRRRLAERIVTRVALERRDRLGRWNGGLVEAARSAGDRRIVALDEGDAVDGLGRDITDLLLSFGAPLSPRRLARSRGHKPRRQTEAEPAS